MSAILIISVFLIVVASIAILRTKRQPSRDDAKYFQPDARPPLLFSGEDKPDGTKGEAEDASEALRKSLLSRAAQCDFEVLKDARGDSNLYLLVLNRLVESAASAEELGALADFITRSDDLRASAALAGLLLEDFEENPSRASVTRLLRVAALSDDASVFERAVSSVTRARKSGRLDGLRADELQTLFEGEYWLLSSEAKRSGAGFLLKQRLARARRELSAERRRDNSPTAGGLNAEAPAQKERQ